jgi:hypothetical protein
MKRSFVLASCTAASIVSLCPLAHADGEPTAPTPAPASPATPDGASQADVRLTVHASSPAAPTPATPAPLPDRSPTTTDPGDEMFLHGFRLGYGYIMNYDQPIASLAGQSLKDKLGLRTPQQFLIGYEFLYRATGHSWLNVILVANATIAGLEQSKFLPTANGLIGFEFDKSFQVGVGPSLTPLKGQEAHVIIAAGWTPRVGRFYVPVHAFFVPDVDGLNRMGLTTGVTW